jgi:putative ABC transport system permease protein
MTLITLTLACAVVMAVFSARASLLQTVDDIGSWWRYDAAVLLSWPVLADELLDETESVNGVAYAETWIDGYSIINRPDGTKNEQYFTVGFPHDSEVAQFQFVEGRLFKKGAEEVVLNNELFNREDYLAVGDTIDLDIAGEQVTRTVVGVVTGSLRGPALYFERDDLAELTFFPETATRVYVRMDAGLAGDRPDDQAVDSVRARNQQLIADRLEDAFDDLDYAVSDTETAVMQLDEARGQLGILTRFLIIMAGALAAVGVIGLMGSMTLSVIESTREIGIMRSIGASHAAIFGIYVTEGLVVGTISWFLGALLSYPLSFYLMEALRDALGMSLAYRYSYAGVAITLGLVWLISALGSVVPAWRASQVAIRDAITYE